MQADTRSVFLNVPFDSAYERKFIWIISGLVALSHTPRSALEIPEDGQGRLRRLHELITSCGVSIHDLSRVGTPVRFNMPFELGIAYAASVSGSRHKFMIFESKPRRLQTTLSDMNGRDPMIRRGSHRRALYEICGAFSVSGREIDPDDVCRIAIDVETTVGAIRNRRRFPDIFSRMMFQTTVQTALKLAADAGMIDQ